MEASMRKTSIFAAAFALAAAAFTMTMLTKPPVSEAQPAAHIDTYALTIKAEPLGTSAFDAH
ncbi:hypothetical protein DK389_22460 [Methylobacterium durans]|uniref:Uncharacterized protein n=1 Tax=Methylobacterium durans TaxID=2202825 RepID=A0A2U8W0U1_9HYPH|nr:hypothetical protein DK389_03125 [Methylobacterium durans]AWN42759.1 hypothetical protein DK389_22460 [Methylobacterium durans]